MNSKCPKRVGSCRHFEVSKAIEAVNVYGTAYIWQYYISHVGDFDDVIAFSSGSKGMVCHDHKCPSAANEANSNMRTFGINQNIDH